MAIQVKPDGRVAVRCPMRVSMQTARTFAGQHEAWIQRQVQAMESRREKRPVMTAEQVKAYRELARRVLTAKTAVWAERMGATYGRIAIRQQATRWGSCSAKGNLNFNWTLILLPDELQDYVVVHELAHRRQMNHSPQFWSVVAEQLPDYAERRRRLRGCESQVETAVF